VKSESVRDRKDTRARDIEPLSPVLGRRTVMYKDGRSAVHMGTNVPEENIYGYQLS
jgi:hypothetical protein